LKGFSERNIGRMIAFYRDYPDPAAILPQAVAEFGGFYFLSEPHTGNACRSWRVARGVFR
jgi:hypothetical protein